MNDLTRREASQTSGAAPDAGELLDGLFKLSGDLMSITDVRGTLVRVNSGFTRLMGWQPDELVGRPWWRLLHPDELDETFAFCARMLAGGEACHHTNRLMNHDGTYRHVAWSARTVAGGSVVAVSRDCEDERAVRSDLAQSVSRLQAILDNSLAAIWMTDLAGRYLVTNRALARPLGVDPDELIGRTGAEACGLKVDEDDDGLVENDRIVLRTGEAQVFNEVIDYGVGPRHLTTVRFPLPGRDGEVEALCGIATDVTRQVQANEAHAARQRLIETMAASSPDLFWVFDPRGEVLWELGNFVEVLGYAAPSETRNFEELADWVHPDDLSLVRATFAEFVSGAQHFLVEQFRVRAADDQWVHLEARGRPMHDDRGELVGLVVTARDVTAQHLLESDLRWAKEQADAANQAKSEFLSRMSHELRTPLNSILGFGQLLEMDHVDDESAETVGYILSAGQHLLRLINDVLDVARIESGRIELSIEPVSVREVIERVEALARADAEACGVAIHVGRSAAGAAMVLADPGRLTQALLNLVINAVKYNDRGGRVAVECVERDGKVCIDVIDTGWGITPDDLPRVFEPFHRGSPGARAVEGSGVGLALARQLMQAMHGDLSASSTPDVGSTFSIELPVSTHAADCVHR